MRLQLPGTSFSAWVQVDGTETDIFEPTYANDQNGPMAKCWIASETGKPFTIHFSGSERKHFSRGLLYVDGVPCGDRMLRQNSPINTANYQALKTSGTVARYLTFSPLSTTEDEDGITGTQANSIGEIKIVISYVQARLSSNQTQRENRGTRLLVQDQKVNEKSKKAGSHRARLGAETIAQRSIYWTLTRTIAHVGTFIFYYRPRDILVARGIIPRPKERRQSQEPELVFSISDHGEEDAVASEITKLQKKLRNIREGKRKREPDATRVKREELHVPPVIQGEVLDLTELSD